MAWYTKCPISLELQDMEENGCTGNSLAIWHEVTGPWNGWCVSLILFDFNITGYLQALVYTEKTQTVKHCLKCIINTRNTITSGTIYHVTAGSFACVNQSQWWTHWHSLQMWANSIFFAYSSRCMAQLLNKQWHTKTRCKEKQV